MAYIVMAYVVMAYVLMAYIVMTYVVMAPTFGRGFDVTCLMGRFQATECSILTVSD